MAKKLNTNTSIVDYLKSIGKDSSIAARRQLAVELGVVKNAKDYTGTAAQNTALLRAAKKELPSANTSKPPSTATTTTKQADKSKQTSGGKVAEGVNTTVTTGVDSTATEVIDNLAQLIAEAVPEAGDYSYKEFQSMAKSNPQLRSAEELAQLYGLDYDLESIYNTLMASVDAGYDVRWSEQDRAEGSYATNMARAQSALADTLSRQQSQAILTGTNKGMQAAQALSSMLGVSQQFTDEATRLAQDRQTIAKEYAASRAQTGAKAFDTYTNLQNQLADISKNVYSSDVSRYVGELDLDAAAMTSNAQLAAQSIAARSQFESNHVNAIANAYQAYYQGQISLEQARIQANAAIESAKVYGLDAARITSAANKVIADINREASKYMADQNYNAAELQANATTRAAQINADSYAEQARLNSQGSSTGLLGNLLTGFNSGQISPELANSTLDGYLAMGVIDQAAYDNVKKLLQTKPAASAPAASVPASAPATPKKPSALNKIGTALDNVTDKGRSILNSVLDYEFPSNNYGVGKLPSNEDLFSLFKKK